MNRKYKSIAIYTGKCLCGFLLCYAFFRYFPWVDYSWSLISVALVLTPEGKDALDLAITRIKANIVGAGTGIFLLLLQFPNPLNICLGAVLSLLLCDILKLNAGAKSTLAALIIILLHKEGSHVWDSALHRVSAVAIGCTFGLLVTFIFHTIFRLSTPAEPRPPETEQEA